MDRWSGKADRRVNRGSSTIRMMVDGWVDGLAGKRNRAGEGYTLQSNCVDGANAWVPERLDGEWAVDEWVQ